MRNKNIKIVAGIVTYNPDIDRLLVNLYILKKQVDLILIVDNGSINITLLKKELLNIQPLFFIENEKNLGIAKALNQIGKYANKNGYHYFLTLDQDTICEENLLEKLIEGFQDKNIGMVGPYVNRYGDLKKNKLVTEEKVIITSGSLVLTSAWKNIKGFWEYLFIDEVDHEFCYRLRAYGYRIIQIQSCCIDHIIGTPNEKKILGHHFNPTHHTPTRRYYMTRNSILMLYLYPHEKEPFPNRIQMLFRIFISITMCETQRIKKYKAMTRGCVDALYWIAIHPPKVLQTKPYYLNEE